MCTTHRFWPGSTIDHVAGECFTQSIQARKFDETGLDVTCTLPTSIVSSPAGMQLFRTSSCTGSPQVSSMLGARSSSFGEFTWYVWATSDGGHVVSSPEISTLISASLRVDAGPMPLVIGECNAVEVTAHGVDGGYAVAAADTAPQISIMQGASTRSNCGETQFSVGNAAMVVGVLPMSAGPVTLTVSHVVFPDGVTVSLPVCRAAAATCGDNTECCSGTCSGVCN